MLLLVATVRLGFVQVVAASQIPNLPDETSNSTECCLHGLHT